MRLGQIRMNVIRKAIIEHVGLEYKPNTHYSKLPSNIGAGPLLVGGANTHNDDVYSVLLLTSEQAEQFAPNSGKPRYRIFIWCADHRRWVPAGKYIQHLKFHKGGK